MSFDSGKCAGDMKGKGGLLPTRTAAIKIYGRASGARGGAQDTVAATRDAGRGGDIVSPVGE